MGACLSNLRLRRRPPAVADVPKSPCPRPRPHLRDVYADPLVIHFSPDGGPRASIERPRASLERQCPPLERPRVASQDRSCAESILPVTRSSIDVRAALRHRAREAAAKHKLEPGADPDKEDDDYEALVDSCIVSFELAPGDVLDGVIAGGDDELAPVSSILPRPRE